MRALLLYAPPHPIIPGMAEPHIIRRARRLRRAPNTPEDRAWAALRKLRGEGFAVRRQHPVGGYIVDFAVVKARLVIEVDGGIHGYAEIAARDEVRQRTIEASGWRVLRLPAEIALSADHLLDLVRREIGL